MSTHNYFSAELSMKNTIPINILAAKIAPILSFEDYSICSGRTSPVDIYRKVPAEMLMNIAVTNGPYSTSIHPMINPKTLMSPWINTAVLVTPLE